MGKFFQAINVYPAYGKMQARIAWRMTAGNEGGSFIVFKSPDGINDWQEIGAVVDQHEFIDPHLLTGSKLTDRYYRVTQQRQGRRNDSDIVSTFGQVTRQQFGVARYIMGLEFMSLRQFTPVSILKIRLNGPPCSVCTDLNTGQKVGTSLCEICYGTGFSGGYFVGVSSFMRIMTTSPDVKMDRPDGAGTDDPVIVKIRMMAFPLIEKDDLLVAIKDDRRYIVDTVDYSYLAGEIPLVASIDAQLLRRSDVKYKLKA